MKKLLIGFASILVMVAVASVNPVAAGERMRVFEMGESGQTVSFPLTDAEITKADMAEENSTTARSNTSPGDVVRMTVFEMGESAQVVSFPMTAEEIIAALAEEERLYTVRAIDPPDEGLKTVVFELAESGGKIEFPTSNPEIGNKAVASNMSSADVTR